MKGVIQFIVKNQAAAFIAACLFIALWSVSGLQMPYATHPIQSPLLTVLLSLPPLAGHILQIILYLLDAFIIVRFVQAYRLHEQRTTLSATLFFMGLSCCNLMQQYIEAPLLLMLLLGATQMLLGTYQERKATSDYFMIFVVVGIASLIAPTLIWLFPLFFICGGILQSLTFRTFMAGILGAILPYWLMGGILFLTDDFELMHPLIQGWTSFVLPDFHSINLLSVGILTLQLLLTIPALFILFAQPSLNIRTRCFYRSLAYLWLGTFILMITNQALHYHLYPLFLALNVIFGTHLFTGYPQRGRRIYIAILCILWLANLTYPLWKSLLSF